MLARWFDRAGLGQLVAPDESIAKEPSEPEASAPFWQLVAPDPNFIRDEFEEQTQARAGSNNGSAPPPPFVFSAPTLVQCQHCHKWTSTTNPSSVVVGTPDDNNNNNNNNNNMMQTPQRNTRTSSTMSSMSDLNELVLSAAKDTAVSLASPSHVRESRNKVFRLCASAKPINDKLAAKLRKILTKDPSMAHIRATHLGNLVPDGYTPLMATAHCDDPVAAKVLLEVDPSCATDRDMQGRTALHIAAEMGHMKVVQCLLQHQQGQSESNMRDSTNSLPPPAPIDLLGRTPLGRAVTSPNPTARKKHKELEKALFSPGDASIFGAPKHQADRMTSFAPLHLAYGTSDMPGFRVEVEDAICTAAWHDDTNNDDYCLVGVCDGHGDQGNVSNYLASQIPMALQSTISPGAAWDKIFTSACKTVDSNIKELGHVGGSTAVFSLITKDKIVVANIGDCRCILLQLPGATTTKLEGAMNNLTITDDQGGYPPVIDADQDSPVMVETPGKEKETLEPASSTGDKFTVTALSFDHKPELETEKSRIEAAGMGVIPITFEEDGREVTIHKVEKSKTELLAVSRAFGDFEYKANDTLDEDHQAIIVMPDVVVQPRNPGSDKYLILACDGIWDVMSNEEVSDFIFLEEKKGKSLAEMGDALLEACLDKGSRDNMSVVVVALNNNVDDNDDKTQQPLQGKTLNFSSP